MTMRQCLRFFEMMARLLVVVVISLLLALTPVVALILFSLGGGPLPLAIFGFGVGAAGARWSRVDLQIAALIAVDLNQSYVYYLSATGVPRGELVGDAVALAVVSLPLAVVCGAFGRWFGHHILYRQIDHLRRGTASSSER